MSDEKTATTPSKSTPPRSPATTPGAAGSSPGAASSSPAGRGGSSSPSVTGASPASSSPATSSSSPLKTDLGTTTIADTVVSKVAALATRDVDGVAELGGSFSGAISGVVGRIRGDQHRTQGVGVEVGETQAAVDLKLKVLYPASIRQVADAVRQNVDDRITELTGLEVVEVNIEVIDLVFPGDEQDEEGTDEGAQQRQEEQQLSSSNEPASRRVQ